MTRLGLAEVEYLVSEMVKKGLAEVADPRPANILEKDLAAPFENFIDQNPYPGTLDKGAVLFYRFLKEPPFGKQAQKQVSLAVLLAWLDKNSLWLKVSPEELGQFTEWVLESHPRYEDEVIGAVKKFLKANTVREKQAVPEGTGPVTEKVKVKRNRTKAKVQNRGYVQNEDVVFD